MSKKSNFPETKVKNKEPSPKNSDWIIWAAWADRITFEEIFEKTGKTEAEVIKFIRKRVAEKSIKHRKLFSQSRKKLRAKISIDET